MISIINSDNLGKRKRNLTLAPCYIDTNIIINATLESEPEWQHKNETNYSNKENQIKASYKLLHEWNPDRLYTSRYAIAEFFVSGQTGNFGKTFNELNKILNEDILVNCKLLPAKFSRTKIPNGIGIEDDWKALEIKWEYNNFEKYFIVAKDGISSDGRGGGLKNSNDNIFAYKGENLKLISYEFPFLEYMMFIEICKLKISKSVGIKDILHLIYAK